MGRFSKCFCFKTKKRHGDDSCAYVKAEVSRKDTPRNDEVPNEGSAMEVLFEPKRNLKHDVHHQLTSEGNDTATTFCPLMSSTKNAFVVSALVQRGDEGNNTETQGDNTEPFDDKSYPFLRKSVLTKKDGPRILAKCRSFRAASGFLVEQTNEEAEKCEEKDCRTDPSVPSHAQEAHATDGKRIGQCPRQSTDSYDECDEQKGDDEGESDSTDCDVSVNHAHLSHPLGRLRRGYPKGHSTPLAGSTVHLAKHLDESSIQFTPGHYRNGTLSPNGQADLDMSFLIEQAARRSKTNNATRPCNILSGLNVPSGDTVASEAVPVVPTVVQSTIENEVEKEEEEKGEMLIINEKKKEDEIVEVDESLPPPLPTSEVPSLSFGKERFNMIDKIKDEDVLPVIDCVVESNKDKEEEEKGVKGTGSSPGLQCPDFSLLISAAADRVRSEDESRGQQSVHPPPLHPSDMSALSSVNLSSRMGTPSCVEGSLSYNMDLPGSQLWKTPKGSSGSSIPPLILAPVPLSRSSKRLSPIVSEGDKEEEEVQDVGQAAGVDQMNCVEESDENNFDDEDIVMASPDLESRKLAITPIFPSNTNTIAPLNGRKDSLLYNATQATFVSTDDTCDEESGKEKENLEENKHRVDISIATTNGHTTMGGQSTFYGNGASYCVDEAMVIKKAQTVAEDDDSDWMDATQLSSSEESDERGDELRDELCLLSSSSGDCTRDSLHTWGRTPANTPSMLNTAPQQFVFSPVEEVCEEEECGMEDGEHCPSISMRIDGHGGQGDEEVVPQLLFPEGVLGGEIPMQMEQRDVIERGMSMESEDSELVELANMDSLDDSSVFFPSTSNHADSPFRRPNGPIPPFKRMFSDPECHSPLVLKAERSAGVGTAGLFDAEPPAMNMMSGEREGKEERERDERKQESTEEGEEEEMQEKKMNEEGEEKEEDKENTRPVETVDENVLSPFPLSLQTPFPHPAVVSVSQSHHTRDRSPSFIHYSSFFNNSRRRPLNSPNPCSSKVQLSVHKGTVHFEKQ